MKEGAGLKILRLAPLFLAVASVLSGRRVQAGSITNYPFLGITHITRTETSPRNEHLHIVQVDLGAPGISFKLSPPGGTRDTIRQTTLNFLTQEQAQVAINGHFFLPFPSSDTNANVVGLAVSQGLVYSPFEPQPIAAGYVDQSYAILPYGPGLNIDASNHATIVHRDTNYPDNKHVLEPVTLWNALSGSAQIVSNGVKTIPTYSGPPNGLNPLNGYSDANSWYAVAKARSCVGVTRSNQTLVLFTVDQVGGSGGMGIGEVADMLIRDYQVYNALDVDGGGSTTLALQDPVTHTDSIVNVSGDNPLGRSVGSSLAVFAQPVPVFSVDRLVLSGAKLRCTNLTGSAASPLALSSAGPASAHGGTAAVSGRWVFYSPALGWTNTDTYPYTIHDSLGASATGTVTVTIRSDTNSSPNYTVQDLGQGLSRIHFAGIPGRAYSIQVSSSLAQPSWQPLGAATADSLGAFEILDTPPGGVPRFYRSTQP